MINLIFFTVFLCQVILISIIYSKKMCDQSMHILETCPPSDYPKLYENSKYAYPGKRLRERFRNHYWLSLTIGTCGLLLLTAMLITGYAPSRTKENGHIVFVVLFFVLQSIPYILHAVTTQNWHRNIRGSGILPTRKADLRPRKILDFIPPTYIATAALAFIGWLTYYLYNKGLTTAWDWQTYVTVVGVTVINLIMIAVGLNYFRGKKFGPYQAYKDQKKSIETLFRVFVFASVMLSLHLAVAEAINRNGWDEYEPLVLSLYFQAVIIFGLGEVMRRSKIENMDFSVYQKDQL